MRGARGWLLQPRRAARGAQARRWGVRLKTNRQTDTSVSPAGFRRRGAPGGAQTLCLGAATSWVGRHPRSWRDLYSRKAEKNIEIGGIFLALWLRDVYLDRLDCFISTPWSKAARGAGAGELAPRPPQDPAVWGPPGLPTGLSSDHGHSISLSAAEQFPSRAGLLQDRVLPEPRRASTGWMDQSHALLKADLPSCSAPPSH